MPPDTIWRFLIVGYLFSIAMETPILLIGLSGRHTWKQRLLAGIWLTACTYPIVILVLPRVFDLREHYVAYLIVAETFAPAAECLLFWLAFDWEEPGTQMATVRDMVAIVLANLASFGLGRLMDHYNVWQQLGVLG